MSLGDLMLIVDGARLVTVIHLDEGTHTCTCYVHRIGNPHEENLWF